MTPGELHELRERVEGEASLVEDMARFQEEGLEQLRAHFAHEEFLEMVTRKRAFMEALGASRAAMRPLTDLWIKGRQEQGLTNPSVEMSLERLRVAFDRLRQIEEELEGMATAYLAKLSQNDGSVEDRIHLHRSWS